MAYHSNYRRKAEKLRSLGYSYKEIGQSLYIPKSTAYAWTHNLVLSKSAHKILESKITFSQIRAIEGKAQLRQNILDEIEARIDTTYKSVSFDKNLCQITASLLYWAEGAKTSKSRIEFMNSDPKMISVFMHSLRYGFTIDESKFRGLVHIHEYHDDQEIKKFWSQISGIPLSQFNKSYLKQHTQKRIHYEYKGCLSVRYYDYRIAAELKMIYNKLPEKLGV